MIDWARFTLFLYILMRMAGFVLFNPILGRQNIPSMVRAGFSLVLALSVASFTTQTVEVPRSLIEFAVKLLLELSVGFLLGIVVQFFFYIPVLAGEIVDTQMGMTMAKTYDSGSQASMSVTSTLFQVLMMLLFFAANGHYTMLRILLTSGDIVPFGQAALGQDAANAVAELFITCTLLGLKLALPILAAELMGQVGMGILMKVIPQINVFSINIELKVIIGLAMVVLLMVPFGEFFLGVENQMLVELQNVLAFAH